MLILSLLSRQEEENQLLFTWRGFFWRKFGKTYSLEFKQKVVEMYELEGIPYRKIIKEFNLNERMFFRWVEKYRNQGIDGLEDQRGKAKGPNKGRPRKKPLSPEEKIMYLEAEVDFLKKLLNARKEAKNRKGEQ